jgi:hypothetical protein
MATTLTTAYPEKTCEIDRLVTRHRLVELARAGQKTQQRRDGLYAYPGETFQLEGGTFIVTAVGRRRVGDMTEDDARAEGYPDLETYRDIILRMHKDMVWSDDHLVWVHSFMKLAG